MFHLSNKECIPLTFAKRKQPAVKLKGENCPRDCLLNTNTAAPHQFCSKIERFRRNQPWSPQAHLLMQDYYVIPLDESPVTHSPGTPLMTPSESRTVLFEGLSPIQCYYTSEFRKSFLEQSGGIEPPETCPVWTPEDPLPPPVQNIGTNGECFHFHRFSCAYTEHWDTN